MYTLKLPGPAAHAAHLNPGKLLIKSAYQYIDCKKIKDENMVHCIIPLHVITACDAESRFYGKGKSKLFEKVSKSPRAQEQLQNCGEDVELEEECVQELLAFTEKLFMVMFIAEP